MILHKNERKAVLNLRTQEKMGIFVGGHFGMLLLFRAIEGQKRERTSGIHHRNHSFFLKGDIMLCINC